MDRILHAIIAGVMSLTLVYGQQTGKVEWVVLRVNPHVLLAGGNVNLTCRIEPHIDNREIELGIESVRTSTKSLESKRAPRVHFLQVMNMPCGTRVAYCTLRRLHDHELRTQTNIVVGGCNEE